MADVFSQSDARDLLKDKFVLLIGDSNMRSIYKDLLCLLHVGGMTPETILRKGGQSASQYGDEIIDMTTVSAGRNYFEVRQCKKKDIWVRFLFVTQAAAPPLMKEIKSLEDGKLPPPAIIIINSCLWDITRWGPEQEDRYKQNVADLFKRFHSLLPPTSLVVWTASLPVATERVKGGVFIQQIEFVRHSMRFMLLEANVFTQNLCRTFGFSFLDLHYYMQYQLNRRTNDGLHWEPPAVRFINNLLLTHIALSFGVALPGNVAETFLLQNHDKVKEKSIGEEESKIYLDSKVTKYLRKLGLDVNHVANNVSPTKGKETSNKKDMQEIKRNTGAKSVGKIKSALQHQPSRKFKSNPMTAKPSGHCLSSLERKGSHHRFKERRHDEISSQSFACMQMNRPPLMQGPPQMITFNSQFNDMNVGWSLESRSQQSMPLMPSYRYDNHPYSSYNQPNQQQFHLNPIEFWRDYPVEDFPWNYQQ